MYLYQGAFLTMETFQTPERKQQKDESTKKIVFVCRLEWYTSGQRDTSRTDRYVWTSTNVNVDVYEIELKDKFSERTRDILGFVHNPKSKLSVQQQFM